MATVNIKQNNINFTVDDVNTPKSWNILPGSTFAPTDLGPDFNTDILKTAETDGWLNDLRILHGLFIDWDGAQITLNGTTYTIHNTGELFSAIQDANKTYPLGNYQGKLRCSSFYTKYHDLLRRIDKLIDDKTSYIEPLSKIIRYRWYDRAGVNIGDEEGIDLNETITMLPGDGLTDEGETFIGWLCTLDGKLYQPSETFTLTEELYDLCEDGYLIQFRAEVRPSSYSVGIDVTNGKYSGTSPQTIEYGGYASWEVYADEGYKLPISVTNGTISGNMVTSDKVTNDFMVYVNCVDLSYIEPAYAEYYFLINNIKVFENTWIDLDQTITIPTPPDGEIGDGETFEGWQCELNGNLYQPGDQYTLTQEDYDKITEGTFAFSAVLKTKTYQVGINVTNGWYLGTSPETIEYNEQASWVVYANEGYKLPTLVTNGIIFGDNHYEGIDSKMVMSDKVTKDFTVDVVCEEDVSYIEPGSSDPELPETEPDISYIEPDVSYIEPGSIDPESSDPVPGSIDPE